MSNNPTPAAGPKNTIVRISTFAAIGAMILLAAILTTCSLKAAKEESDERQATRQNTAQPTEVHTPEVSLPTPVERTCAPFTSGWNECVIPAGQCSGPVYATEGQPMRWGPDRSTDWKEIRYRSRGRWTSYNFETQVAGDIAIDAWEFCSPDDRPMTLSYGHVRTSPTS